MKNWEFNEVLLLVDCYMRIVEQQAGNFQLSRESIDVVEMEAEKLSRLLRLKASCEGKVVDEQYRNVTGIKMKLHNIEYVATEGKTGLSNYSSMDKKGYEFYIEHPAEFYQIVYALRTALEIEEERITKSKRKLTQKDSAFAQKQSDSTLSEHIEEDENYEGEPVSGAKCSDHEENQSEQERTEQLIPFFRRFRLDPTHFSNRNISEVKLSVRAINLIRQMGVKSVGQLLKLCEDDLTHSVYNDVTCIAEIVQFCSLLREDVPYFEKYGINTDDYQEEELPEDLLSVRTINALRRINVFTVGQLLRLSPSQLSKIKNLGKKSIAEVDQYLSKLKPTPFERIKSNRESIAHGDFSSARKTNLSEKEITDLIAYEEAYSILGDELVLECFTHPVYIYELVSSLYHFSEELIAESERRNSLFQLIEALPEGRASLDAYYFISAFSSDPKVRAELLNICPSPGVSFKELGKTAKLASDQEFNLVGKFISFCCFDIEEELEHLFNKMYRRTDTKTILEMRANNQTLEAVGNVVGVTRERIRQIEAKAKREFNLWYGKHGIILKISALLQEDGFVLSPVELEEYFRDNTNVMVHLLKSISGAGFFYDKQTDLFYVGDDNLGDRLQNAIDGLPDLITKHKLDEILVRVSEEANVPKSVLEKAIVENYHITGDTYHRHTLSLSSIYKEVLNKFYADGIYVYSAAEISRFRNIIYDNYGDISLPQNDRAIVARITDICVLCGRGKYMPKKKEYIPREIAEKIYDYIDKSEQNVILTNTIFSIFEDELCANGIDNRFYLQGVLRELYGDQFIFRRDYISKNAASTNMYLEVVKFIKRSDYPVSKSELYMAFPGITDIIINIAVNDPDVINLFGQYIYSSKLRVHNSDREYLADITEVLLSDGTSHHCKELYERVKAEKPELLERYGIYLSFSFFSLLQYLFKENYRFDRPYIALQGASIDRAGDKLREMILESDEIAVADISSFAKENRYVIYSLLDYITSFNQTHLMRDHETLIAIQLLGVDENTAKAVESILCEEVVSPTPIAHLQSIYALPTINLPWNEWLVYSILKRWGCSLEVGTTSPQYRFAIPVVGPCGSLSKEVLEAFSDIQSDAMLQPDDLDNIDDLIADSIFSE